MQQLTIFKAVFHTKQVLRCYHELHCNLWHAVWCTCLPHAITFYIPTVKTSLTFNCTNLISCNKINNSRMLRWRLISLTAKRLKQTQWCKYRFPQVLQADAQFAGMGKQFASFPIKYKIFLHQHTSHILHIFRKVCPIFQIL